MWVYNSDFNKWELKKDSLIRSDYEYLKQELYSTRLYSSFLSGATYVPISDVDDIYDILGKWKPRNWYLGTLDSVYSVTTAPSRHGISVDSNSIYDYQRFTSEYGLTLKNLFTPTRAIRESMRNFIEVDLATTEVIDVYATYPGNLTIDGVVVKKGHRILVKDQISAETLDISVDPSTYFASNYRLETNLSTQRTYSYYNFENGIYEFDGSRLIRDTYMDEYERCVKMSVYVKMGVQNSFRQFHLSRLLSGYFPTTAKSEPIEFTEKKNWLLRHRVDYNNLFEINYYDVIRHPMGSYEISGMSYNIPERTVAVGEFGIINNTQYGISSIIPNKYKVNLRSISKTDKDYWICGDDSTLLRVRQHDFHIEKTMIREIVNLKSVSFYDSQRGAVVGDGNTILMTFDGGDTWQRLRIPDFDSFSYTKVLFTEYGRLYVGGRNGIFLDIEQTPGGWTAYKRRISKFIDNGDEQYMIDNINDLVRVKTDTWLPTYEFLFGSPLANKDILFIVTDNGGIIAHDISRSTAFDFLYLSFPTPKGDILNISNKAGTDSIYFSGNSGLYNFDLSIFPTIGTGGSYSNTMVATSDATLVSSNYANEIFDYQGANLILAGNNSLLVSATYSLPGSISFQSMDAGFEGRLKSKLLFLDYDMASKLNFFTDQGNYRLPSPATFSIAEIGGTELGYSNNVSASYTSSMSELTRDIVVPTSALTKGKFREMKIRLNIVCGNLSLVGIGLKKVTNPGKGKVISVMRPGQANMTYAGTTYTNMTNFTFTTNEYATPFVNVKAPYSSKTAKMDLISPPFALSTLTQVNSDSYSEMIALGNGLDMISGTWRLVINNLDPIGNPLTITSFQIRFVKENSYLSLYPVPILPKAPSYISGIESNWWTYRSDSMKNFEYWSPNLVSDSTAIYPSSTFSSYSGYSESYPYMLDVVNVVSDESDINLLMPSFGQGASTRFNSTYGTQIDFTNSQPKFYPGGTIYLKDYLMVIETDMSWSVSTGDILRMESGSVDGNFMVNKIVTAPTASVAANRLRKFIYVYTDFEGGVINDIKGIRDNGGTIKIWNTNKYLDYQGMISNFEKHPISNAYSMTFSGDSGILTIDPVFNSESAYYNLSGVVNYSGTTSTMSYTDGFLKFGYSPKYNVLDYLESINKGTISPVFYAEKEYYSLPILDGLPISNGTFSANTIYIPMNGSTYSYNVNAQDNKLAFGDGLKLEWDMIMKDTFVDITIYQPSANFGAGMTYSMTRMLVMDKMTVDNYLDSGEVAHILEFHKRLDYELYNPNGLDDGLVYIRSRRKLKEISDDLQELNNIHMSRLKVNEISLTASTATFSSYGRDLGFKIPTDSYAKVLLSDSDTVRSLSAIFYVDHKNELAMNITKLDRAYDIKLSNTTNYNGNLYIQCGEKHDLVDGDGIVLEFNGGTYSSQYLNRQYSGYRLVKQVINEYDFLVEVPYGVNVFVGNDSGRVKYLKKDPFLNYQATDLIEVNSDKRPQIGIKLDPENTMVSGPTFSLVNVDYGRYRYRLVDGMSMDRIMGQYPWILDAEISDAIIGIKDNSLVWYKGVWESGRWFSGTWISGTWKYGDWYGGTWNSKSVSLDGLQPKIDETSSSPTHSVWQTGRWYDGTWTDGTWVSGRRYDGIWENGNWYSGIWNDGTWNFGRFIGGIWVTGTWNGGFFNTDNEPSFWIDGIWNAGDFENGIWYNGTFRDKNGTARFGINSSNSRTAIWYGGKWRSGDFYSGSALVNETSDVHKYSVWYSGKWYNGNWHGGIAYNMDFSSGIWHGGIMEDIQVIGINSQNNSFILNGVFRFNIGDMITIIDDGMEGEYSRYGSIQSPKKYTVLKIVLDEDARITEVYVDLDVDTAGLVSFRKNSGTLNLQIPNNSTYLAHTQSITLDTLKTDEIRVKLNLRNKNIGDLIINLKSPTGMVMNLKPYGPGGTMSGKGSATVKWEPNPNTELFETIFTTGAGDDFAAASSPYLILVNGIEQSGVYSMYKSIGDGDIGFKSNAIDYRSMLSNGDASGDWTLYVKDANPDLMSRQNSTMWYGLEHSRAHNVYVRYGQVGNPYKVSIVNNPSLADGKTNYAQKIRSGDLIELRLLQEGSQQDVFDNVNSWPIVAQIPTLVDSVSGDEFTTTLVLSATASAEYVQFFQNANVADRAWANIIVSSNPNPDNVLVDWELQLMNPYEVGAQIGYGITDGIETNLRAVSSMRNAVWKSGIWTNGIFDGNFQGGIWLNGIFDGKWP